MFRNKNTAIIEDIAPWNRHKPFFIVRRRQSSMQFCTYVKLPFIRLRFLHLQNTVHFSNGLVRSCILYWSARSKYFSISSFAFKTYYLPFKNISNNDFKFLNRVVWWPIYLTYLYILSHWILLVLLVQYYLVLSTAYSF